MQASGLEKTAAKAHGEPRKSMLQVFVGSPPSLMLKLWVPVCRIVRCLGRREKSYISIAAQRHDVIALRGRREADVRVRLAFHPHRAMRDAREEGQGAGDAVGRHLAQVSLRLPAPALMLVAQPGAPLSPQ